MKPLVQPHSQAPSLAQERQAKWCNAVLKRKDARRLCYSVFASSPIRMSRATATDATSYVHSKIEASSIR